jgi:hypothetical protein
LIAKSTRNLRGFEFEDAEISLFNLGAGKHPELPQICERYFDKLKECREAQWNASLYEYALLSADKIKSIPVVGDRIYATDNYDLQASVDSWIQAPSPRWIVWRACEAISKKFSDERKKVGKKKEEDTKKGLLAELVHKIALALESQRPLSTRVKIDDESFIFRIFIVDDMIPAEQKEMRIVELIGVFALQIAIKINVRFIYRTTYEEWYKSRRRSVAPSNLTSGSKIPDFQIVCREERERWRVVSGINATNFPPDGTPEIHGQIVQNEQTWFAFFEELWSEAAKPTDIPEVRDQLLKPDIESTVSTIFEKSLVSVEKTDEQNRIRQITELAREALREYKSKNFPDSAKPTS